MSAAADFGSELFDLFGDITLTIYSCCCMPCQNAKNWSRIRGEECSIEHLFCHVSPYWTRQFIRSRKHMKKDVLTDALLFTCCAPCAIIQDSKELNNGFGVPPETEYFYGGQSLVPGK